MDSAEFVIDTVQTTFIAAAKMLRHLGLRASVSQLLFADVGCLLRQTATDYNIAIKISTSKSDAMSLRCSLKYSSSNLRSVLE